MTEPQSDTVKLSVPRAVVPALVDYIAWERGRGTFDGDPDSGDAITALLARWADQVRLERQFDGVQTDDADIPVTLVGPGEVVGALLSVVVAEVDGWKSSDEDWTRLRQFERVAGPALDLGDPRDWPGIDGGKRPN